MPTQTRKTRSTTENKVEEVTEDAPATQDHKSTEDLKKISDELMDEIDELLATADVDATQYINKGGE